MYTVDFYNTLPDTNAFCFEVSYIMSRDEYVYNSTPAYLFTFGEDIVLLRIPKSYTTKWLNVNDFTVVDTVNRKKITNKLVHGHVVISHHGEYEKLLFHYDGHHTRTRYCRNPWGRINSYPYEPPCCGAIKDYKGVKDLFDCDSAYHYNDSLEMHMNPVSVPAFNIKGQ